MGIIIRQSIKTSIATYIGVLIGVMNVLFLFNKFLTTEQLGFYTVLSSLPVVFASFANLGTQHVGVRFFSHFSDPEKKHNGFFGYLLVTPLIGFTLFLIIYILGQALFKQAYTKNSPLLVEHYWYFPVITFFLLYNLNLEAYARAHLRIVVPTILREIFLKLSNSALALLFGFSFISFNQLLYGILIAYFLNVCFLFIYIKMLGRLYLKFDFSFLKTPIFKEMYRYGLWTILGGLTATLLVNIEQIMLPAFKGGLNSTAIFFIATNIGLIITIPRNAVAAISEPLLAAAWRNDDTPAIETIYRKSSLNLFIIGSLLFLGIWSNIDSIFKIIPNAHVFSQGKFVVLMVGLNSLFDMATGLNSEVLKNSKLYRFDLAFYILRFIFLIMANLVLIPAFSFNGAAFALLISGVAYNVFKLFFIKQKLHMQPFVTETVKVFAIGLITFAITLLFPNPQNSFWPIVLNMVLKSITILLLFGGTVFYLKLSTDINSTINNWLKTKGF